MRAMDGNDVDKYDYNYKQKSQSVVQAFLD